MTRRIFGEIAGHPEGKEFKDRWALHIAGVHRPPQAGICGSGKDGAESIVLNGGYEDDRDDDDEIVYTGHGGNDSKTGEQVEHQKRESNPALKTSKNSGQPVRVIRGAKNPGPHPEEGYRYDGLYQVKDSWYAEGKAGYRIWRFKLVKV